MKKTPASATSTGESKPAAVPKRSSVNQTKRRSSVSQTSRRSSINQASKRSSINQASKRSSANATKRSIIDGIAEASNDEPSKPPQHNVNRVSVLSSEPRAGSLPAHFPNKEWGNPHRILPEKKVAEFLKVYPQVLLDFMYDTVELDTLEELLREKNKVIPDENETPSKPETQQVVRRRRKPMVSFDQESTRAVGNSLIDAIQRDDSLHGLLEDMCSVMLHVLHADSYNLYVQEGLDKKYFLLRDEELTAVSLKGTPAGEARRKRMPILVTDLSADERFMKRSAGDDESVDNSSILCAPLVLPSGAIPAIIEVKRNGQRPRFTDTDIQIASVPIGWIAACASENFGKKSLMSQQYLIDFLLENTKELFDGVTQTEHLVPKIMRHTKELVRADRCSLFLLDEEKDELYANFFDEGAISSIGTPVFKKKEMIRFPKDRGIAGYVARNGEVVNIHDAYEDPRFNKEVDLLTGYKTRNILCMPIINRNCVKGVIQMVNSTRSDHFTPADESALKMFTVYCAIALHYNNFYSTMDRQKVRNEACIQVIKYHTVCDKSTYTELLNQPYLDKKLIPKVFFSYDFYSPTHLDILPELFIHMMGDICGKDRFDLTKLVKFILTIRKNYRAVAYHNFPHGFHVAHCLWRMLLTAPDKFTVFEKMGLMVAGICHDVDHRGYNNEFFKKLQLPLANLYSTSVMEQHHYRQTVTILQTVDIFSFLSPEKYKSMLGLIRHCILATDLSQYFGNQKTLQKLLNDGKFDIRNEMCFRKAMDLMMTASDLCGISKPWKTNKSSTNQLYEEFYDQGDEEKKMGFIPLTMMDRRCSANIPNQQVGFIDLVCLPLYRTMSEILPGTRNLLTGCQHNRRKWVKMVGMLQPTSQSHDEDDTEDDEEDEWVNVFTMKSNA